MTEGPSYDEYVKIKNEIAELEAKKRSLYEALLSDEIQKLKAKIAEFGIKPRQLYSAAELRTDKNMEAGPGEVTEVLASLKEPKKILYRSPDGETWSGGRGRKPSWVNKFVAGGGELKDLEVK